MQSRVVCLVMLLAVVGHAEPAVPAAAQRYLDILRKRPQPGTLFERFYAAWLEEGSAADLQHHLKTQADKADAAAADHLMLALFHSHRGDDREALAAYDAALQMDAQNAGAWIDRSRIEARMQDFQAAIVSLDKSSGANPVAALALDIAKLKGRVLLRLGRRDDALAIWKKLVAEHAGDEDLIEEIIDLFVDEAQFEAAIETGRALVQQSRDPVARTLRQMRLADVLLLAERRDDALSMLDTAFATTGGDTWIEGDVLGRMERLFRMTDDIAGLEKHLAGLVKANPQRVTLAWQHALLLSATGSQEEALKQARTLLQTNPGRRDLHDGFLELLDSLNQTGEAVVQAKLLISLSPGDKELLIRLAMLQQRVKDSTAALTSLEAYISASGATEASLLRVARLLEGWDEAAARADSAASKAYKRLVTAFPESVSALEAQAHYCHRIGKREESLAIWMRLAKNATLDDLLRIAQALQARLESRPALDMLIARETDFAQEPRFLALLVQVAIANHETKRVLPWGLARLRLMRDVEGIQDAMVPLRLMLHRDSKDAAAPLLEELRKNPTPSIQDRCLLAMLLGESGDVRAAEELLTHAPAEQTLIALSQLVRLHQNQQDWQKAAQILQRVIALPDARTPARVQLLVDLLRRANELESALQQIAGWKTLSPSAVAPWLVEARVLKELYREEEALKVLRQTTRKFPDAPEAANAYATACLEANQPAEAERIYLALYEKTTDSASRLRLLSPLALAAESHGALPHLIENFQHRQQQNRASAYPWLALAEIHRATRNDEERRRCLYEASRLRPQDMGLLHEIARSEEEVGRYADAIRTLETAAKLDKTTKTLERIAKLQIENGDPDAGYRILFELLGGSQMAPDAIEQIVDAMAVRGEWGRIASLLQPVLERHPQHYRLHYLQGIALEESGREDEALAVFLRVLDMHGELPGVTAVPEPGEQGELPPGASDWLRFLSVFSGEAYEYRDGARQSHHPLLPPVSASPGRIPLPVNVLRSPAFALAHVLQISSVWPEEKRSGLERRLRGLGVAQAALLLEMAQNPTGIVITGDLLNAHPEDAALHAAWLIGPGDEVGAEQFAAYERCFELFRASRPHLALQAASKALRSDFLEDSGAWVQRIITLCDSLPRSYRDEWRVLSDLLETQDQDDQPQQGGSSISISEEQMDQLVAILCRWMLEETELKHVDEISQALLGIQRWDAAVDALARMIDLGSRPGAPPTIQRGKPVQAPDPLEPAPLGVSMLSTSLPACIASLLDDGLMGTLYYDDDNSRNVREDLIVSDFQTALRSRITKATDPRLRLLLRILAGDTQALLVEWQPRIQKQDATSQDFLANGWLHQLQRNDEEALRLFQRARILTQDTMVLDGIDSACLFLARRLFAGQKSEQAIAAVRPVMERVLKRAVSSHDKLRIVQMMESFAMQEEADSLRQGLPGVVPSVPSPNTTAIRNPYSSTLLQGGVVDGRNAFDRMLIKNNSAGALAEASRLVRQLTAEWFGNRQRDDTSEALTQLLLKLGMHQLREPFLLGLKTNAASGWKPRLEYAAVLEMQHAHGRVFQNNDGDRSFTAEELRAHAIAEYEAVLVAHPQEQEARRQLVMLLALEDSAAALRHWTALPKAKQAELLVPLISETTRQKTENTLAMTRFITSWVRTLDPADPQPAWTLSQLRQVLETVQTGDGCPDLYETFASRPGEDSPRWEFDANGIKLEESLRRQRNDRRIAHDALCRALIVLPDVTDIGFEPLAGLAMFEQRDIEEMEKLALQILATHAAQQLQRRRAFSRTLGADGCTFVGDRIALPSPAVFATWGAARRRDVRMLDEVVYPAILKAEGKPALDFCRGYAELLLAGDTDFPAAAAAWLRTWVNPRSRHDVAFRPGGMVREVVRLWQARKTAAPLDDLFIAYRDTSVASADPFAANDRTSAMDAYTQALASREPGQLRRFILRLREVWVSPDANVRRQAIAAAQEQAKLNRTARSTPSERAAARYIGWLEHQLRTDGSLTAFAAALEDEVLDSTSWMENFTVQGRHIQTPAEFMAAIQALGMLDEKAEVHLFADSGGRQNWATGLARTFRDTQDLTVVRDLIDLLGHKPASLDTHLLQALLVREGISAIHLGDKTAPLQAAGASAGSFATRDAAFRLVVLKHAGEIAALPAAGRLNLGAFLANELPGFLNPTPADTGLTRALAPVLQARNANLAREAERMLAFTKWEEFGRKGEPDQIRQLLKVMRDLALHDRPVAEALARHALKLVQNSNEQRQAVMASLTETPVDRFVLSLGQVPPLLGIALMLADKDHSHASFGSLSQQFESTLTNPASTLWALQDTPFVGEAGAFRDLAMDDADEPTQLARIITFLEKNPVQRGQVQAWLMRTPDTFGIRFISALLYRDKGEVEGMCSFYGMRPNQEPVMSFIRKNAGDFSRLKPEAATSLLALLEARVPDLGQCAERDAALKKSLQPLLKADSQQFDDGLTHMLQITSLKLAHLGPDEAMRRAGRLLDRLAPLDKPRAIELLDHVGRLMVGEDVARVRTGRRQPPQHTYVAQWLQAAMIVPELFAEIIQRAGECGAAADPEWMQSTLVRLTDLHRLEHRPERVLSLLEATRVLDPAPTFNTQAIPLAEGTPTLLDNWIPTLSGWQTLPPLLSKYRLGVFGADMLRLLIRVNPKDADLVVFANAHAEEIAATTPEQQKVIAALLHRQGWSRLLAPHLPALQDDFPQ